MKKLTSILLACLLTLGCFALGGCGKAADDKQAFIASQSYYPQLVETLAAPVADIDADAVANAASGMTGRMKLDVEGLSSLGALAPDVGDSLALDLGFVTDGVAFSGDLSLSLLGETLKALFASADEGDIVVSLPDLLDRPLRIAPEMLPSAGYGYSDDYDEFDDFDYDYDDEDYDDAFGEEDYDYDDDFDDGLLELDDAAYEAEYDFDENGKFFAENGDLYVDTDGDGMLDIAFAAGKYDEEIVDSLISNTREFYSSYDGEPFLPDDYASAPFGLDAAYVSLAARYAESFLDNISEGCYSSGREKFRTADGEAELDCLTLKADGNELIAALKKTFAQIAEDEGLDEIFGEYADAMREHLRSVAAEETPKELEDYYDGFDLDWKRFTRGEVMVGERFGVKLPDGEYTLETGVDGGLSPHFAFLKLTDEKQGVDLLDAESKLSGNSADLKLRAVYGGVPYSLEISGKTSEQNGAKTTDADVRLGVGSVSVKLFKLTTAVRAFTEDAIDFDVELALELPKLLVGSDVDLRLACSVQLERDDNAKPAEIDASGAYTQEEMQSEEFSAALESALKEKLPKIYGYFESRQNANATDESDA